MRYFSLFSGIGGFELGIIRAYENHIGKLLQRQDGKAVHKYSSDTEIRSDRPTCVGYSEIDKYAIQIYEKHFKHKNFGNIRRINPKSLPDFDLLVGGFPCQSFSVAGKRKGFKDTRGTLFFEIARIIATKKPKLLLLENVKGLLSHDGGRTFGTILSSLDELGYDVQWEVLNSKNFGVPQNRERVFIVGHLRKDSRPEIFSLRKDDEGNSKQHVPKSQASRGVRNMSDLKSRWRHTMRIRKLTPKECERLQGFPDGWTEGVSDTQRYKTLGNAVTVNVVVEIAKRIIVADKKLCTTLITQDTN